MAIREIAGVEFVQLIVRRAGGEENHISFYTEKSARTIDATYFLAGAFLHAVEAGAAQRQDSTLYYQEIGFA